MEKLIVYTDGDCTDDNIVLSLLNELSEEYQLFIKFYGVEKSCDFKKLEKMYINFNVEFKVVPSKVAGKNTTDVILVTDLLRDKHDKSIKRLLITNDFDYSYSISTLLLDNYIVNVASRHSMKQKYLSSCSEFIDIDKYSKLSTNFLCKVNKTIYENKSINSNDFIKKIENKISGFTLESYGFDSIEELLESSEIKEKYFYEIENDFINFISVDDVIKMICDVLNQSKGQLTIDKLLEKIELNLSKDYIELLVEISECLHIKRNILSVKNSI